MGRRLLALLAVLVALLLPVAAQAATAAPGRADDGPSSSPSTAPAEEITGTAITVVLSDKSNLDSEGDPTPIPGVTLTVSSEDGTEVGDGVTDAEGRAVIEVPEKGTYTVTLEEDTLPDGIALDDNTADSITIAARLDGPNNFGAFPIGVVAAEKAGFGERLSESLLSGVKFGLIVALAALGLALIFGTTGLTNFAHGELITLGALIAYLFNVTLGLPVILAAVIAVALSGAFGWAQDAALWRPLRKRGTGLIAMMIVSIGLGIFLRSIFQYFFDSSTKSYTQYTNQARRDYGIVEIADKELVIMLVAIVAISAVCVALVTTRFGKAMRAVSDNPALAASSGLRVDGVIRNAWVLGTLLSGLAGVLLAVNSQVNFLMGFKLLLLVFAAVTLGGLGTVWGALVGSMVIGLMVEVGPLFGVPSSIKEVGALVVLILVLLVRPQGILGRRERIG